MKFFDRTQEVLALKEIRDMAKFSAQFTVITGRRRIGKTSLVWKAYEDEKILYFFVTRKTEKELCEDYQFEIESKLGIATLGPVDRFAKIFELVMKLSLEKPITLFIDEFQEFFRVNKSIYSEMQRIWDIYNQKAHINLIVCGSIYSMMTKIFKNRKEPLYNRQNHFISINTFTPSVIKEILKEYNPEYTKEDLLALYSFTGGVAKYVQILMELRATTKEKMVNAIIRQDSIFLSEGKAILIEEFGKDYGIYFSIISSIARGKTSRSEIEKIVGREIGGYLTKLENEYGIITKKQPLFEKSTTKNMRYFVEDNFFKFWFRFIFKYNYMLEIQSYESLKAIINRDFETFSGQMLERWFICKLIEEHQYTRIGNWWNRKGEDEIDIIAENELKKKAVFFEVKRKKENINIKTLKSKAENFLKSTAEFKGYSISFKALSIDDM